jgi:hypothetical protein
MPGGDRQAQRRQCRHPGRHQHRAPGGVALLRAKAAPPASLASRSCSFSLSQSRSICQSSMMPPSAARPGLLAAALTVREGRDVKAVLSANTFNNRTTWNGSGFRLLDVPATNANHALLTWAIANDMAQRQGPVAILTPDAGNAIIRAALNTLQTKQHTRKNGATFGPYPPHGTVTTTKKPTPCWPMLPCLKRRPAPSCARF